jgi:hypothetical protein
MMMANKTTGLTFSIAVAAVLGLAVSASWAAPIEQNETQEFTKRYGLLKNPILLWNKQNEMTKQQQLAGNRLGIGKRYGLFKNPILMWNRMRQHRHLDSENKSLLINKRYGLMRNPLLLWNKQQKQERAQQAQPAAAAGSRLGGLRKTPVPSAMQAVTLEKPALHTRDLAEVDLLDMDADLAKVLSPGP